MVVLVHLLIRYEFFGAAEDIVFDDYVSARPFMSNLLNLIATIIILLIITIVGITLSLLHR